MEALRAIREYAEKAYEGGKSDGAFYMAMSHAVGMNPDLDHALQWLEIGKADYDWHSQYALLLIKGGMDTVEAFKTVSGSGFKDWMNAFTDAKSLPANITPPRFVELTRPRLPSNLAALNVKGDATVRFVVGPDGTPQDIEVLKSSHPDLADAAVKAVETWKLTPALKDGRYKPMKLRIPFRFSNGQ